MAALEDITNLYTGYFNRAPDPAGLNFWIAQRNAGASLTGIAQSFSQVSESTSLYSYLAAPLVGNPVSFLNSVYLNLFGRAIDSAGQTYWTAQLANPAISIGRIIVDIISGAQGDDALVVANKQSVGKAFAQKVVDTNVSFSLPLAQSAFKGVTKDAATVTSAIAANDAALLGGAGSAGGQTFTLTTAIDNILGTGSNDTIIGDNNTASAADQANGAGGIDTLKLFGNAAKPSLLNIEKVYLNGNTAGFSVATDSSVTNLDLDAVATAQTYTLANGQALSVSNMAAGTTVNVAGNTVTALNVGLTAFGSATAGAATLDFQGAANTSVSLTGSTSGSNLTLANTGAKLATLNIDGSQAIGVTSALTTLTTIDASKATGAISINGVGASNLTFTGGSGNDKLVMGATVTGADVLKGGTGTDTLSVSDADTIDTAAEVIGIAEFEVFQAAGADGTTYDLSFLGAKNTLTGLIVSGGATVTVSNINAATTGNISIVADTTTVLTATDFVSGGTSDTATITTGNGVTTDIDVTLTFANVDVLNLKTVGDSSPTKVVGGGEEHSVALTATDVEKIVITGNEALALTTAAGTLPTEIDASGMTAAAVNINTNGSAITSILVKGTALNDTIVIDNAATVTSTLFLGGGSDTVTVDGGGTSAHTLKFTATALNAGDIKAGNVSTVTPTGVAAGDILVLDFTSALEGILKSGATLLSATTANINIHGTTLSATNNIAAAQAGGNMVVQIDLNGDGAYTATDDYQVTLVGTGTNDTLVYNAASDTLIFTVVA